MQLAILAALNDSGWVTQTTLVSMFVENHGATKGAFYKMLQLLEDGKLIKRKGNKPNVVVRILAAGTVLLDQHLSDIIGVRTTHRKLEDAMVWRNSPCSGVKADTNNMPFPMDADKTV